MLFVPFYPFRHPGGGGIEIDPGGLFNSHHHLESINLTSLCLLSLNEMLSVLGNLKKMKSKRDIRSQKLFLTDACILYLFDKWNHSSS